jgi:hypothetical protein
MQTKRNRHSFGMEVLPRTADIPECFQLQAFRNNLEPLLVIATALGENCRM